MKTAADCAAEAIEAAEIMFAEEMGAILDLSPAAKMALIEKSRRRHRGRRRRREAEAHMGVVSLAARAWANGAVSEPTLEVSCSLAAKLHQ